MGQRKKSEKPDKLSAYTIKHTRIAEQLSGVFVNGLHLLKETEHFVVSIESWSHCLNNFKAKKDGFVPEFNIPTLTETKAINLLNKLFSPKMDEDADIIEAERFLSEMFPGKKFRYIFELHHLFGAHTWGAFDKDCEWFEKKKEIRDYYLIKNLMYYGVTDVDIILDYKKSKKYIKDNDMSELTDILHQICKNTVVCPYILPEPILKKHDGEIYFINSPDTIYYEIRRSI